MLSFFYKRLSNVWHLLSTHSHMTGPFKLSYINAICLNIIWYCYWGAGSHLYYYICLHHFYTIPNNCTNKPLKVLQCCPKAYRAITIVITIKMTFNSCKQFHIKSGHSTLLWMKVKMFIRHLNRILFCWFKKFREFGQKQPNTKLPASYTIVFNPLLLELFQNANHMFEIQGILVSETSDLYTMCVPILKWNSIFSLYFPTK